MTTACFAIQTCSPTTMDFEGFTRFSVRTSKIGWVSSPRTSMFLANITSAPIVTETPSTAEMKTWPAHPTFTDPDPGVRLRSGARSGDLARFSRWDRSNVPLSPAKVMRRSLTSAVSLMMSLLFDPLKRMSMFCSWMSPSYTISLPVIVLVTLEPCSVAAFGCGGVRTRPGHVCPAPLSSVSTRNARTSYQKSRSRPVSHGRPSPGFMRRVAVMRPREHSPGGIASHHAGRCDLTLIARGSPSAVRGRPRPTSQPEGHRMPHRTVAVILAGGIGVRVGLGIPKQLIKIAGKAIVEHTLEVINDSPLIDEIIIVMNAGAHPRARLARRSRAIPEAHADHPGRRDAQRLHAGGPRRARRRPRHQGALPRCRAPVRRRAHHPRLRRRARRL